jgi:hypothetical protein
VEDTGVGSAVLGGVGVGSSIGKLIEGEHFARTRLTHISRRTIHDCYVCNGTKAYIVIVEELADTRC